METATLPPSLAELRARLPGLTPRDQRRLGRRLEDAAALRDAAARDEALGQLITELSDGRTFVMGPGQSYVVSDGDGAHRSRSPRGRVF